MHESRAFSKNQVTINTKDREAKSRIKNVYTCLKQQNLDGLIVKSPANISYLTGYPSRDSYLVISKKQNIYITDFRYYEEARRYLKGFGLKKTNDSIFKLIAKVLEDLGIRRVGFEEKYVTFEQYRKLKEELKKTSIDLIPTSNIIEELRQIKTAGELKKIKKAVDITIDALEFIRDYILPGKKEIEIAAELERFIRYNGAFGTAFNIIVASGPNSSFPHHITSQRRLQAGEPVLIDIGVDYFGYKSDLTRVFFLGRINPLIRRVYDIVRQAQELAIKQIKPAITINKVDKASRQYIAQKGYAEFFGHSLGHGIGLQVHEAPRIASKEDNKLKPGMVFTVEPAIYLPAKFGIRIEDMVLVTTKGVSVLSGSLNK